MKVCITSDAGTFDANKNVGYHELHKIAVCKKPSLEYGFIAIKLYNVLTKCIGKYTIGLK